MRRALPLALLVALAPWTPARAAAQPCDGVTSFCVHPSGNDLGTGTLGDPWATVKACYDNLTAGQTCYLRQAVHPVSLGDDPAHSGTPANPIVYSAYPGESALIQGEFGIDGDAGTAVGRDYIEVRNLVIYGAILVFGSPGDPAEGWVISNVDVFGGGWKDDGNWSGVFASGADGLLIEDANFHDMVSPPGGSTAAHCITFFDVSNAVVQHSEFGTPSDCIQSVFDKKSPSGNVYRRNIFGSQVRIGNNEPTGSGVEVYENIFLDQVWLVKYVSQVSLYNNLFLKGEACTECSALRVGGDGCDRALFVEGNRIFNNVFAGIEPGAFYYTQQQGDNGGAGAHDPDLMDFNAYPPLPSGGSGRWGRGLFTPSVTLYDDLPEWQATGFDGNGEETDPLFVDPDNLDFHLQAGSPLIDKGCDIPACDGFLQLNDIGLYPRNDGTVIGIRSGGESLAEGVDAAGLSAVPTRSGLADGGLRASGSGADRFAPPCDRHR